MVLLERVRLHQPARGSHKMIDREKAQANPRVETTAREGGIRMKRFYSIKKAIKYINGTDELPDPYSTGIRVYYIPEPKRYRLLLRIRGKYYSLDYLKASEIKSFATYLYMLATNEGDSHDKRSD